MNKFILIIILSFGITINSITQTNETHIDISSTNSVNENITQVPEGFENKNISEEIWTLEKCINHAMEKNLDLKISHNIYKKSVYTYKQSVWELAPTINSWAESDFDFKRSTNQNNEIESGNSYSIGYGISSSLTLFAGFTQHNNIAAQRFYKLATGESTRLSEYQLEMEIIEMYSNALYQRSLVEVAKEKLEVSMLESERITATIETGKLEQVAQNEINATVATNRLELRRAENEFNLLKLRLAQTIEIPDIHNFTISDAEFESTIPENAQPDIDSLYNITSLIYPAVNQREYEMEYYKKILHVSRGSYSPTLTMNGGYSSGYYSTDTLTNGDKTSLSSQFDKYGNPYLGVSLNIPILAGQQRNYKTKKSRIDVENAILSLENQKKQLRRELEEVVLKLEALYLEYSAAKDNLSFTEKSFETYLEKYRLGLINTTDFMTAQNQYSLAKSNVMLARYSWVVQKRTLDIYMGRN